MICERQGEALKPGTHSGKISYSHQEYVTIKTKYLVNADPKKLNSRSRERVALVEGVNTLPYFVTEDPELFAELFTKELYDFTDTYRTIKKPPKDIVIDRVIAFSPEDNITPELALDIVKTAVEKVMGPLSHRLGLFAVHTDKEHTHVHFLMSTVSTDGKIFNPRDDDKAWNREIDKLEIAHDFKQVGSRKKATKKKPTNKALQYKKRTGGLTQIEKHQAVLDLVIEKARGDFCLFLRLLTIKKMQLVANMKHEDSPIRGMSFLMDDELLPGGSLGTDYRWGKLKKKIGFDDKNSQQSLMLYRWMKKYEKESNIECTVTSSHSPAPDKNLYDNVQNLFDFKPEETTDLPHPTNKPKTTTLYRAFSHEFIAGDIVYYWRPRKSEAFREQKHTDNGHVLFTKHGSNKTICKAMLERAKELNWSSVRITGSTKYKELVVMQAKKLNIRVFDDKGVELVYKATERTRSFESNKWL